MDTENSEEEVENMDCEQIKPVQVISPAPSCLPQSDQSIHRPKQQLRDRTPRKRRNKRLRPDEATSPSLSCTSLQSDKSMDRPIKFQERTQNRVLRPDEATSPSLSRTSLQSDKSMDRPIKFQERTQNRVLRPDDATSPSLSCTSLQSDKSMDRPIKFQERTQNRVLRPDDATSPSPSCTSLQSDKSMDRPIKFQESIIKNVEEALPRHRGSLRMEVMSPDISTFSATLLTEDHYRCSVCTQIFKNPVSIPCGHSYCQHCIEIYWNKPTQAECYACPQCRKRFRDRPVLNVNMALSKLIEELKRAGFSPILPAHCYAGPEDVSCDICSDMKLKAVKSCLTCGVSYCDTHIRQHYTVPALQRHNLIQVTISTQAIVDTKETKEFETGKMFKINEELREENKELRAKLSEKSMIVKNEEAEFSNLAKYFYSELASDFPKDVTEVVALGRSLDLGMLYDCHNDSFTSDTFLWVNHTFSNKRVSLAKLKTHVKVLEDDCLQERCKAFEMSPMLRVSAQCGVINLNGAAVFLNHPVQSEHQDRVTLHYKTITRLDTISQTLLQEGVSPSLIHSTTATHVIIAVSYGAQAFFVFDNERISTEKNTEVKDVVNKMISTFSVQDIRSSLTDAEKSNSILYDCTMYTDVGDWKSPVSFDKAVEIYSSLPELLGSKGERAVPLKVWLYPLKKLDKTSVCAALREVLLLKVENILERLRKQIRLCQDKLTDYDNLSVLTWFPTLTEKLKNFSDLLQEYKTEFQRKIADVIQSKNINEEGEKTVQELISISDQSPFSPTNTQRWLVTKDIELVVLNLCRAANISIVKSQKELQRVIHDSQKSRVFCFTVYSVDAEDSFLTAMKQHVVVMKKQTLSREDCLKPEDTLQSLKSMCISQNVVSDLQQFIATKETCEETERAKFIAASVPADCDGHTVQFFYDRKILSRNVKLHLSPDPATIIDVEDTGVHMKLKHPQDTRPVRNVVEYRVMDDDINSNTWDHSVINASALGETYTLSGLKPNTQYQLRYMVIYKDFMSYISENSTFKTCKFAPKPGQPFLNKKNVGTLRITWLKAEADEDCPVLHYMVEYKEAGLEGWSSVQTQGPQCEYTLTTPHSTCYRVRVSAVYEDITSKPSEETSVPVDVWRINLSKRKSSILLEVLKLQTEKKPVELIDWTHEESEVRGFLQCLPYISQLRSPLSSSDSFEKQERRNKLLSFNLCLQEPSLLKEITESSLESLFSYIYNGNCEFLFDLYSHVKNYENQTDRCVQPALQSIYHQSSPEVWRINLSKRKSSILLEVLKLQTEKKPVELIDWTHEGSEVRGFLQCLPYISELSFTRNVLTPKRESAVQFLGNLFTEASEFDTNTEEKYTELLTSVCNYTTFPFDEEYYNEDDEFTDLSV